MGKGREAGVGAFIAKFEEKGVLATAEQLQMAAETNMVAEEGLHDDKLREELTKKVKAFAELYAAESSSKDGPYFLGESFSLVDLAIVPFIYRFAIGMSHYRALDLLAVDDKLKRWHDAVTQRPSWKTTAVTREALIQSMAFYANPPQQ